MNVKQLKVFLENLPDDMEVILQKDAEGNGYSPLSGCYENAIYVPITTWYGNVYSLEWTAEEAGMTENEWENIKNNSPSLILYPIN